MASSQFYIGSYSIPSPWTGTPDAHGAGISSAMLDPSTGDMVLGISTWATNPSFLVANRGRNILWAITEPEKGGDVLAYTPDAKGALELLGSASTGTDAPCHLTIDIEHRAAFVSHYHGSSVAVVSLNSNGLPLRSESLTTPPASVGRDDRSDAQPRPHSTARIGSDELLVADCGRDLVLLYRLHPGGLELLDALALPVGTGPRHIAWDADRSTAYVSNQNVGSISVIAREDNETGPRLRLISIADSPGLGRDRSIPSEIALHPNGSFLYMANRWDNSLSVFEVIGNGDLVARGAVDVQGTNPRYFALNADSTMLLVANQDSDDVTSLWVSGDGSEVEWTGRRLDVATPTFAAFW